MFSKAQSGFPSNKTPRCKPSEDDAPGSLDGGGGGGEDSSGPAVDSVETRGSLHPEEFAQTEVARLFPAAVEPWLTMWPAAEIRLVNLLRRCRNHYQSTQISRACLPTTPSRSPHGQVRQQ